MVKLFECEQVWEGWLWLDVAIVIQELKMDQAESELDSVSDQGRRMIHKWLKTFVIEGFGIRLQGWGWNGLKMYTNWILWSMPKSWSVKFQHWTLQSGPKSWIIKVRGIELYDPHWSCESYNLCTQRGMRPISCWCHALIMHWTWHVFNQYPSVL